MKKSQDGMESLGSQWYLLRMSQRSKKHKREVGIGGLSGDREWENQIFCLLLLYIIIIAVKIDLGITKVDYQYVTLPKPIILLNDILCIVLVTRV